MDIKSLLVELYGRIPPLAQRCVADLDLDQLTRSPKPGANTIAWLIWHLARVQDHHLSEILGVEQLWVRESWAPRFGLVADPTNTGYGHSTTEMAAVRPDQPEVLMEYLAAADRQTSQLLATINPVDLDRIVDRRWDPPVTMGVRLVSVADDCLQHVGQASYVKGLLDR